MFQFLQGHLKKIFGFLLIFIIPSFCLYFVGGVGKTGKIVGKLYGKKITHTELERAYKASYLEAAILYGAYFKNIAPYLNLEKNAWERLMLLYKADLENVTATPEEVQKSILEFFKKISGKDDFDSKAYKYFVNTNLNMDVSAFENMMSNTLKIKKLKDQVTSDIVVSDEEVKQFFIDENNKIQFSYLRVKSADFKDKVEYTEEELAKAFSENRNEFTIKEKVSLEYLFISPRNYEDKVEIDDDKIKSYYDSHKEDYLISKEKKEDTTSEPEIDTETAVPEEIEENSYKSLDSVKEEIKEKIIKTDSELMADEFADKIYREMVEKESFSKIVEKYDLNVKETELFTRDNPPSVIGDPSSSQIRDAFEIPSGDFSGPYNHLNGWLLIKIKEKQAAKVPEKIAEVKDKVIEFVQNEKAPLIAEEAAKALQQKIKPLLDKKTFEEAVKQVGEKVSVSGMINKKTVVIRGLGNQKAIVEKAFMLKENELSQVLPLANSKDFLFMKITRRSEPDMKKLADSIEAVKERTLADKKKNYYSSWLKNLEKESDWQIKMPVENSEAVD